MKIDSDIETNENQILNKSCVYLEGEITWSEKSKTFL